MNISNRLPEFLVHFKLDVLSEGRKEVNELGQKVDNENARYSIIVSGFLKKKRGTYITALPEMSCFLGERNNWMYMQLLYMRRTTMIAYIAIIGCKIRKSILFFFFFNFILSPLLFVLPDLIGRFDAKQSPSLKKVGKVDLRSSSFSLYGYTTYRHTQLYTLVYT